MANKKLSELTTKTSIGSSDLFPIADATTGQLYKKSVADLAVAIGGGVSSVNTLTGVVVLNADNIAEAASPTNKYFTDSRARAALSAGTGISYNSSTGVITNTSTSAAWGSITGTLSAQTDLQTALNAKQATISLTTTGSSGASTFASNTLNIPNYTLAGLGGQASSPHLTSLSGLTYASLSFVKMSGAGTFSLDTTTYYPSSNPSSYTANTGTVTSVGMTVPTGLSIAGSPITSSGTLAVTMTSGYAIPTTASQTTWDTAYTNRITSLTTSGSSGSATLASNVLNVPTYTLTGLGGQPLNTNLTSLAGLSYSSTAFVKMTASGTFALDAVVYYPNSNPNGYTTNTGTVTSVSALSIGTTGSDISSSVANASTTPTITLNIPTASSSNRGALSASDWTTFNGKKDSLNSFSRKTASYTLVLGDKDKVIEMNVGSANTLTIPTNASVAFTIGTEITIMQYGAGQTTIAQPGGVTIRSKGGYLKIADQYTGVTLVKVGTDEWYLIGNLAG
jgi:hypothetical protein